MRKSRYTEEQIVGILKESEAGVATPELCRKHGVSQQTFYRWKAKYGGLEVSEAQRLRHLEEENRKLKQLVAEQALDIVGYKAVLKSGSPRRGEKRSRYFGQLRNARSGMLVGGWRYCGPCCGTAHEGHGLRKRTNGCVCACESWLKSGAAGAIDGCMFCCSVKAGP
jgi:putative transposase